MTIEAYDATIALFKDDPMARMFKSFSTRWGLMYPILQRGRSTNDKSATALAQAKAKLTSAYMKAAQNLPGFMNDQRAGLVAAVANKDALFLERALAFSSLSLDDARREFEGGVSKENTVQLEEGSNQTSEAQPETAKRDEPSPPQELSQSDAHVSTDEREEGDWTWDVPPLETTDIELFFFEEEDSLQALEYDLQAQLSEEAQRQEFDSAMALLALRYILIAGAVRAVGISTTLEGMWDEPGTLKMAIDHFKKVAGDKLPENEFPFF